MAKRGRLVQFLESFLAPATATKRVRLLLQNIVKSFLTGYKIRAATKLGWHKGAASELPKFVLVAATKRVRLLNLKLIFDAATK